MEKKVLEKFDDVATGQKLLLGVTWSNLMKNRLPLGGEEKITLPPRYTLMRQVSGRAYCGMA